MPGSTAVSDLSLSPKRNQVQLKSGQSSSNKRFSAIADDVATEASESGADGQRLSMADKANKGNSLKSTHSSDMDNEQSRRELERERYLMRIRERPLCSRYDDFFVSRRRPVCGGSSYLHPGSVFIGTQTTSKRVYQVKVEIKHVNMDDGFLCGYFHIDGLTYDRTKLVTYFEAEMISEKHSFFTGKQEWKATEKDDILHWSRFASWLPIAKEVQKPGYVHSDFLSKDHIFMRWKEYFLVPDHKITDAPGASYNGFYYICFNQLDGSIIGYYYAKEAEHFQQLELSHDENWSSSPAYEFR